MEVEGREAVRRGHDPAVAADHSVREERGPREKRAVRESAHTLALRLRRPPPPPSVPPLEAPPQMGCVSIGEVRVLRLVSPSRLAVSMYAMPSACCEPRSTCARARTHARTHAPRDANVIACKALCSVWA